MANIEASIVLAGVGGQGTLLASRILGNTVIREGYDTKVSEPMWTEHPGLAPAPKWVGKLKKLHDDGIDPYAEWIACAREAGVSPWVSMRMNEVSSLTRQKYTLKLSNSSGIKEKDAVKIDLVLKAMKYCGNTTVTSEARNEARRFFEYEIDF